MVGPRWPADHPFMNNTDRSARTSRYLRLLTLAGLGLGLSIVKHLVESMGGDVRAESELGKGTVIRFRLPAAEWQKQHVPELPQSSAS